MVGTLEKVYYGNCTFNIFIIGTFGYIYKINKTNMIFFLNGLCQIGIGWIKHLYPLLADPPPVQTLIHI